MTGIEDITIGDDIVLYATVMRPDSEGELQPVDLTGATIRFSAAGVWNGAVYGFTLTEGAGVSIVSAAAGEISISFGAASYEGFPTLAKDEHVDLTPEIETVTPSHGRETMTLDTSVGSIQCLRVFGQLLTP